MKDMEFKFRLSSDEMDIIRKNANEVNMSLSEYIRKSAVKPIVKIEGLKDYTEQIRKIGINLNQLAVLCHQGKITCLELRDTQTALSGLWKEVSNFRKDIRINGSNQIY